MPTTRVRPDPIIPDHEVLRRVGGGAYGEVWLARGVTGALRAVKVLWREDFEDERSFEREFEGILKYEPISRDHPGLVNVLHVGRSTGAQQFYYYVMELGDDIVTGCDINPIEYEARTLRSDIKRAGEKRLETAFCVDVGLRLAEALHHLHEQGLAHRDVKPANVIFVNGRAKLADIGLVAVRGQRTFVGTEGFVPPEGPGSAQADVYSLGKVLYEMATGKDRLDFPELPDDLPQGAERKPWLALNQIICDVCEPHVSKRKIRTAAELASALTDLRSGKRRRRRRPIGAFVASMAVGGLAMWAAWESIPHLPFAEKLGWVSPVETAPKTVRAFIKVTSTPIGADVVEIEDSGDVGELIGRTPTDVLEATVGERIALRILKQGYQPEELEVEVPSSAAEEPLVISAALKIFAPPEPMVPWTDQFEMEYGPVGDAHESRQPLGKKAWKAYSEAQGRPADVGVLAPVPNARTPGIHTSPEEARKFADWFMTDAVEKGYLTPDHEALVVPISNPDESSLPEAFRGKGWSPFRLLVRPIPYGRLLVRTDPPGAEIRVNDEFRGVSSGYLLVDRVRPGPVLLEVSLEGYKTEKRNFDLGAGLTHNEQITLAANKSVVLDKRWENSLGMRLVPMGKDWMASAWETRRQDFRAYADATGSPMPASPLWDAEAGGGPPINHPITGLSREECEAFCRWLTEKERAEERLNRTLEYRLPTDWEWSYMAGVTETVGLSPARRDQSKERIFPWGLAWPPPQGSGNFADMNAGLAADRRIENYLDDFAVTAPVGSFTPTADGLFDLAGNAQEWVSDDYSRSSKSPLDEEPSPVLPYGVLRGGDWRAFEENDLYIGARNPQPPTADDISYGFRVVLAKSSMSETEEDSENTNEDDG
ncbi:MAG: bifunctional serine/threonine-protein kinase/formylglycine-generating enzyme family protein [Akkermansiaceae bacterium]|nr:bifunctional serine/threonine-protein kinase/formylglycine-generating enzyme family protein [Akkermansiaceae bacterium]